METEWGRSLSVVIVNFQESKQAAFIVDSEYDFYPLGLVNTKNQHYWTGYD